MTRTANPIKPAPPSITTVILCDRLSGCGVVIGWRAGSGGCSGGATAGWGIGVGEAVGGTAVSVGVGSSAGVAVALGCTWAASSSKVSKYTVATTGDAVPVERMTIW